MRDKNQVVLPLNLGICIPEGDYVFKVAEICEELDYTELFNTYLRTWRKVNPITMFEILVFGYMNHKYSSREIEEACKTDIRFMWLLNGEPAPSDTMILRFQRGHLADAIEGLFYQFVEKLYEMGEIKFNNLFVDGTKIEAYANKYTFVWKSAVSKRYGGISLSVSVAEVSLTTSVSVVELVSVGGVSLALEQDAADSIVPISMSTDKMNAIFFYIISIPFCERHQQGIKRSVSIRLENLTYL